ncbi:hypothetical protein [Mucilaginibacter defluvii]|uniref:SIR2-like domain-containing protein n=1 Tax=Mucilaginibacter defluvii TaxID=1196019 RepID=A0ABP9FRU8_9SPHI
MIEDVIKRIEEGPAVLFVGQAYLQKDTGLDVFLSKTIKKYSSSNPNLSLSDYNSLMPLNLSKDYESVSSWMSNLCKSISVPEWLYKVAEIPWSAVYTTAFDTVIERAFINDWRTVQPITDEKFRVPDPRNKQTLHLTYLLGSISETDISKRPPFNKLELTRRKNAFNPLLQKLPQIITPKGILVIEAYKLTDQLSIEELYPVISGLGNGQVLLCSSTKEIIENEFIAELIKNNKVVAVKETLSELIGNWEANGRLNFVTSEATTSYGRWVTINEKKIKLPQELVSRISKSATVIEDSYFYSKVENSEDDRYFDFRRFLSSTNSSPFWAGYPQGFAFKRTSYTVLKGMVIKSLKGGEYKEIPFILYGQSSSGKTTSLGLLAYELYIELHCPVLFIEKRYQKVDDLDIDYFCKWAEDHNAKFTVVIWDGMLEPDNYFRFLKRLNTRGRKVILVGSSYASGKINPQANNYVESPIALSADEKQDFITFLSKINPLIATNIASVKDQNLLAMLYRYLPESRFAIKQGLKNEFDFFSDFLSNNDVEENSKNKESFYSNLKQSGIIDDTSLAELNESDTDADDVSLADQLIFSIMVPGKYGLNVPFELLLSTIGYKTFSSDLFYALNEVKLIEWYEDNQGDFLLGPRTALEAKILTSFLGGKSEEITYIIRLLRNISSSDFISYGPETNPEIQFAVELLSKIGPNSQENFYEFLYQLTDELRYLRENDFAYHPRLILKEASFLREIVKQNFELPEPVITILDRAENIVSDALYQLRDYKERTINTYLRVELAAILGTKIKQFLRSGNNRQAIETYDLLKETFNYAFASNPENYQALDVFAWATEDLLKADILDEVATINAQTYLSTLFELVEVEGVSDQNIEDFYRRKLSFYELVGNQKIADETFNFLRVSGYASGFYLRAKALLNDVSSVGVGSISDKDASKYSEAALYLKSHLLDIKGDGKCLFLLLKCWWISKAKKNFFADEKQVLKFTIEDWDFCSLLVNALLTQDEIYQSATIYYIKGVIEFHQGLIKDSLKTFKILDAETNFSLYGRRRLAKTFLSSNPDGSPKEYSGRISRSVSYAQGQKRGDIYIYEIQAYVPFLLPDFSKNYFQEGEKISRLYIAFNFRGPIAIPAKN